jgi:hypothetical protein
VAHTPLGLDQHALFSFLTQLLPGVQQCRADEVVPRGNVASLSKLACARQTAGTGWLVGSVERFGP